MTEDKLKTEVAIAGRIYRLNVDKRDERNVIKAAEMINERVRQYKESNNYRDFQDLLAMVCLQIGTLNVKYESDEAYRNKFLRQSLDRIDTLLSEHIDS